MCSVIYDFHPSFWGNFGKLDSSFQLHLLGKVWSLTLEVGGGLFLLLLTLVIFWQFSWIFGLWMWTQRPAMRHWTRILQTLHFSRRSSATKSGLAPTQSRTTTDHYYYALSSNQKRKQLKKNRGSSYNCPKDNLWDDKSSDSKKSRSWDSGKSTVFWCWKVTLNRLKLKYK